MHQITDRGDRAEPSRTGSAQQPLGGVAADVARDTGVGDGAALIDAAPEVVAALGFDDTGAVLRRRKAWSYADDDGRLVGGSAEVFLCEDGVDHHIKAMLGEDGSLWVDEQRDFAAVPDRGKLPSRRDQPRGDLFDGGGRFIDRAGKGHSAAHGGRSSGFGHGDAETGVI